MSAARESLLKAALKLSDEDRMLLATDLLDSVPDDLPGTSLEDPEFLAELDRRAKDGSESIPWEQLRAELLAELGR